MTELHVHEEGSDTAPGTATDPVRSIANAASKATRGTTVVVHPGRYPEQVMVGPTLSGVEFYGVARDGRRPVIDGEGVRDWGVYVSGPTDLVVAGFEIVGQVQSGIYSQGVRNRIESNLIHHVGRAGMLHSNGIRIVGGSDARVVANQVHHIGPGGESMGIWLLETTRALVERNVTYLVRKEGIRDWMGLDNVIRSNRCFLNWAGIALNTSTGSLVRNNFLYDNVAGLIAKHLSHGWVLNRWNVSPHWSEVWHNTIARHGEAALWIGQSGPGLDYLDVRNNIFSDAGAALVRDSPKLRGANVIVDGNLYDRGPAADRPAAFYRPGWSSGGGVTSWNDYRAQLGWEAAGIVADPLLLDLARGDLDVAADSPAALGGLRLPSEFGSQVGARGVPAAPVTWAPYPMRPIDSSSKGTWWTRTQLPATVDDNIDTYWMTSTPQNEFVTYDFGAARTFEHFILMLFSHLDKRNPRGYRFEVSDDLSAWRTVLEGRNPDSSGSSYKYELPAPATARYLRFSMLDTFCDSYDPPTNCGSQFVLPDLKVGSVAPMRIVRSEVAKT